MPPKKTISPIPCFETNAGFGGFAVTRAFCKCIDSQSDKKVKGLSG